MKGVLTMVLEMEAIADGRQKQLGGGECGAFCEIV